MRTTRTLNSILICCAFSISSQPALARSPKETILFSSQWNRGIDPHLQLQRANSEDIQTVPLLSANSISGVRFRIKKDSDYSHVANGTPRAEISFGGFLHFIRGHQYRISWQTRIPEAYSFDGLQDEVIAQVHQGPAAGYPPFALFISGSGQYEVHSRTEFKKDFVTQLFGTPLLDRGRLVSWELLYVPDATGRLAQTKLFKDDTEVFSLTGRPNAYTDDDRAYFKFGIYKAKWKQAPSEVEVRTIDFGRVVIAERTVDILLNSLSITDETLSTRSNDAQGH